MPNRFLRALPVLLLLAGSAWAQVAPAPAPAAPAQPEAAQGDIRKSLVKIFTTSRGPDLVRPWQKRRPQDSSGTGVVIEGNRILTNAHVVSYASRVLVQPDQSSDKLTARVVAIAPGIDLAVIELEDPAFFETHPPAAFADALPEVGSTIEAFGYPIGGDAMSVTKGVVSRIEYAPYYFGTLGLRIQVDAALNPGNSGGPALVGGKIAGLVFSGIDNADNIGYLIPAEEIRAFLDDIADGKYDARPQLYAPMQTLENAALRAKLGVDRSVTGLVVTRAPSLGAAADDTVLRQWDIVTHIAGTPIDNAGMVRVSENLRLDFNYLVPKTAKDGKVRLSVVREGSPLEVDVPVFADPPRVLKFLSNRHPSYAVIGPMVFTSVYADHVQVLDSRLLSARQSPIVRRAGDAPAFDGEELVLIAPPFLPHPLTKGYELEYFSVLGKVNGERVKNLRHLVELVKNAQGEYLTFEWDDDATETMVFKREELLAACEEIYEDNGIRSPVSDELKDIWTIE